MSSRTHPIRRSRFPQLAGALAVAVAACTGYADRAEDGDTAVVRMGTPEVPQPDTTVEALWAHLTAVHYDSAWSHWPGKTPLYSGQEPHGMLLSTYLNGLAHDALTNAAGAMPAGAVIVKENYTPDSTLAAVTVMYKQAGYDAEHNDWFWLKRLPDGTVEASGRATMCQTCHGSRADNDYVMTGALGGGSGGAQ